MRVVLLPGMDGSGQLHDEFVTAMAPRFRVEVVAYPAHRVLDDRQLQAFVVDRLPGDAPFLLIGESFSGPIAIRIAASRPPGLSGLVLCASFAASPRPWLGPLRPLLGLPLPIPPARILMPAMMGRWTTHEWTRRAQAALASLSAVVARSRLAEVLKVDAIADLGHIRVPTLYLQASHDRLVPHAAGTTSAPACRMHNGCDCAARIFCCNISRHARPEPYSATSPSAQTRTVDRAPRIPAIRMHANGSVIPSYVDACIERVPASGARPFCSARAGRACAIASTSSSKAAAVTSAPAPGPWITSGCAL